MKKRDVILFGPFIGEFGWEVLRFAPLLPQMRKYGKLGKQHAKYIVLTRKERFDIYGTNADILVPLEIEGDYITRFPNCFSMRNLSGDDYHAMAKQFKKRYKEKYNILDHIFPKIEKKQFTNKKQYPAKNMIYEYPARIENQILVNEYLTEVNKPLVVLGPRHREGFSRNWGKERWGLLYDKIYTSDLMDHYDFIICGKSDEYVADKLDRFYDINKIKIGDSSSLAGLLIEILKRSEFTVGSQSAIPLFSLLLEVEILSWGNQKNLHIDIYNVKKTPATFLNDRMFDTSPKIIFGEMNKILKSKIGGNSV